MYYGKKTLREIIEETDNELEQKKQAQERLRQERAQQNTYGASPDGTSAQTNTGFTGISSAASDAMANPFATQNDGFLSAGDTFNEAAKNSNPFSVNNSVANFAAQGAAYLQPHAQNAFNTASGILSDIYNNNTGIAAGIKTSLGVFDTPKDFLTGGTADLYKSAADYNTGLAQNAPAAAEQYIQKPFGAAADALANPHEVKSNGFLGVDGIFNETAKNSNPFSVNNSVANFAAQGAAYLQPPAQSALNEASGINTITRLNGLNTQANGKILNDFLTPAANSVLDALNKSLPGIDETEKAKPAAKAAYNAVDSKGELLGLGANFADNALLGLGDKAYGGLVANKNVIERLGGEPSRIAKDLLNTKSLTETAKNTYIRNIKNFNNYGEDIKASEKQFNDRQNEYTENHPLAALTAGTAGSVLTGMGVGGVLKTLAPKIISGAANAINSPAVKNTLTNIAGQGNTANILSHISKARNIVEKAAVSPVTANAGTAFAKGTIEGIVDENKNMTDAALNTLPSALAAGATAAMPRVIKNTGLSETAEKVLGFGEDVLKNMTAERIEELLKILMNKNKY